jgi:2-C-methyl-D-erythritol 4-phosphate cytidylyltransferase
VTIVAAIITAAGSGTRLGAPKQFLELTPGERIIDRVVATGRAVADWVGLVVPPGVAWEGSAVDAVIEGGATRFESVAAGVAAVPPDVDVVVVHSASHPLASVELVRRLIGAVEAGADGAVPFLPAVDVIKRHNDDGTLTTIGREGLGEAQAPMVYARPSLDRALAEIGTAVEESAAVEAVGGKVVAVEGELTNLHVTDRWSLEVLRHLAVLTNGRRAPRPEPPETSSRPT